MSSTHVNHHEDLQSLVEKAHVCGLQTHHNVPHTSQQIIAKADQAKRLLTSSELVDLCSKSGIRSEIIQLVIDHAPHYVDQSKTVLTAEQPFLFKEGGALYPAERATACWRDCWNFLRVATYAAATNTAQCTDPQGLEAVHSLYALLGVPLQGMTVALDTLSNLITSDIQKRHGIDAQEALCFKAAFDHLNAALHKD